MGKYASKETSPGVMIWPGSAGIVTYAGGATWGPPLESIAVIAYPPSGIPHSSGSSWGTSYTTTGSGTVIVLNNSPTIDNPVFTGTVVITAGNGLSRYSSSPNAGIKYDAQGDIGGWYGVHDFYTGYNGSASNLAVRIRNNKMSIGTAANPAETLDVGGNTWIKGVGNILYFDTTGSTKDNRIYTGPDGYTFNFCNTRGSRTRLELGTTDIALYAGISENELVRFGGDGNAYLLGGLHIGGISAAGNNNLWIDGTIQEPNFISGWQGNNWQIQADGDAEFNNVLIRGGLSVYELIINQLHYQNGGLIIGAGAGKVATIETATVGSEVVTFHDPEGNDMVPFTAGAIVMCQRVDISKTVANGYTGDVVKKIVRQVASVSGMEVTLTSTAGWTPGDPAGDDTGIIEVGDEICAIGHTSNTSLDSALYLSATDSDNPFLRVMDGVSSYAKWSLGDKTTCKLQLGNLASLASYDIIPASPGYGLYCDNVYLNGRIVLPQAGMTNEGSSDSDIRIYAGESYANRATAPFRVTQDGSLTATGVAELGTATATIGGKASNVAIIGPDIWENAYDGDGSSIHINRIGYNGSTDHYRDFAIYDGKGGKLFQIGAGTTNYIELGNDTLWPDVEIGLQGTIDNVWGKQFIYAYGGVSDNVLIGWNSEATTTNTSYTKLKTLTLGSYLKPNRTLRLKFDLKASSSTSYARIYRNGSPMGTERITSSVTYVTYSEDISGWNPGDAIELYVKSTAGNTASIQNFRICGDMVTSIATELQATAS